ncbi:hypothetical protein [Polyangium sp. 15x6]|uniref:hypothetical protein n=1 Tax=Polyangium sp. 15x6 TaxID=3042687 RepID=UPI00249B3AA1|nr:hypothetical protein [Polyangium sp. 15x6]MDI3289193.1 hypothetical protein [Polyangium sp. 15x6]
MTIQSRKPSLPRVAEARPSADREHRWTISLGLMLAGLSLVACKYGERAAAKGQCPPGEICSDQTPNGLAFAGAGTFNNAEKETLLPTALGGIQTVNVYYPESPYAHYVSAFEPKLVDSRVVAFESSGPATIVLRGVAEGNTLLRLLEPGTTKLLDRVLVSAMPVARVALLPRELENEDPDNANWAVLVGNTAAIGILLFDANDRQVVDEALEVRAHAADVSRHAWDIYGVRVASEERVTLAVRSGGRFYSADVRGAKSIDDIVEQTQETSERPITVWPGSTGTMLCFRAKSGDTTVVGATWRFWPSELVTIERPDASEPPSWQSPSCVKLVAKEAGRASLRVKAGDHEETFALEVPETGAETR